MLLLMKILEKRFLPMILLIGSMNLMIILLSIIRLMTFCQKNAYNDELVVQYEGPKEEPIPPELDLGDFCPIKFSPFDYFYLPQIKLATERREYEMIFRDLPYHYYANT